MSLIIPSSPELNPRIHGTLQELAGQLKELQDYAESVFPESAAQRKAQLDERITQLAEAAKARIDESHLPPVYRAYYWLILGAAYNAGDEYSSQAAIYLQKAVRLDTQIPEIYLQLGVSSLKAGAWRRAELLLTRARAFLSGDERPLNALSLLFRMRPLDIYPGSLDESVNAARAAVQLAPDSHHSWFSLGMSLLRRTTAGDFTELERAGDALRNVIRLREKSSLPCPDARFNLAMLSRLILDLQTAWDEFHRAAQEDASLTQAVDGCDEISALAAEIHSHLEQPVEFHSEQDVPPGSTGLQALHLGPNDEATVSLQITALVGRGVPQFYLIQDSQGCHEPGRSTPTEAPPIEHSAVLALHQVSSELGVGTRICITGPACQMLSLNFAQGESYRFPLVTIRADLISSVAVVHQDHTASVPAESIIGHHIVTRLVPG